MPETSRRNILKAGLTGTVVAAGAAGGWVAWRRAKTNHAFERAVGPGFQPWDDWAAHRHEKSLMTLVRAGILAASAHNAQPWVFAIDEEAETISLYADTRRNTGILDPYLREMFLGLGCCIENMYQAARTLGYRTIIETLPGVLELYSQDRTKPLIPVARLTMSDRSVVKSAFYEAIPYRRTHRGPYIPEKPVPAEILRAMQQLTKSVSSCRLNMFSDGQNRQLFRDLVTTATQDIINTKGASEASHEWMRLSQIAIDHYADGLTVDSMGMSTIKTALAKIGPRPGSGTINDIWLDRTREVHLATAPIFGMISVRNPYDRRETLQAGMLWQRLHLYCTANGIAMQPLNQPLEMVDIERARKLKPRTTGRILELLPETDMTFTPTFAFRMGYSFRAIPPSPRRGPDDVTVPPEQVQPKKQPVQLVKDPEPAEEQKETTVE